MLDHLRQQFLNNKETLLKHPWNSDETLSDLIWVLLKLPWTPFKSFHTSNALFRDGRTFHFSLLKFETEVWVVLLCEDRAWFVITGSDYEGSPKGSTRKQLRPTDAHYNVPPPIVLLQCNKTKKSEDGFQCHMGNGFNSCNRLRGL